MAVLHHAFRCPVTPDFEQEILRLSAAWNAGDRARLSAMAIAGYGSLAQRDDIYAAFHLDPEGDAFSWMQPDFISPGLAAVAMLAGRLIPIPGLSASTGTNHSLLESQLPSLGWSAEEVASLVRGQPVEAMLQRYAVSTPPIGQGGFRHTGGWTAGPIAKMLKTRLGQLVEGGVPTADDPRRAAWSLLTENHAFSDAQAMLAEIVDNDWLVMAITH